MSLALFHAKDQTLTWLGVGNVDGLLLRAEPHQARAREALLLRGGVVGYQLPPLRAETVPVEPEDVLILATDGIRSRFPEGLELGDAPQEIADRILAQHAREADDALVLVARFCRSD
jgi:hypothetical protein